MFFRRYPITRTIYMQCVGRLLAHRVGQILRELGYTKDNGYRVWINPRQGKDVDCKVWSGNQIVLVAEILNWCPFSLLSQKRKNNIIKNLSKYNCNRVLIYTIFANEYELNSYQIYGISTVKIGFQLLPKSFYKFFASINCAIMREIDSRNTKQAIKFDIWKYLQSRNIVPVKQKFQDKIANFAVVFSNYKRKLAVFEEFAKILNVINSWLLKMRNSLN